MTKLDNSFQLKTRIPKDLAANIVHNFFELYCHLLVNESKRSW